MTSDELDKIAFNHWRELIQMSTDRFYQELTNTSTFHEAKNVLLNFSQDVEIWEQMLEDTLTYIKKRSYNVSKISGHSDQEVD